MDTNVSTIASDEEVAVQLEDSLSSHPGKLENSDIALFKQQLSESNTLFHTNIHTSDLNVPCEQAEDLIDLSQELEKFLKKGTQTVATPKQNTHALDQSIQKSSSPQQHTDKPNLQTTSKPKQDKLENTIEHKNSPEPLLNEKPSVQKSSNQDRTPSLHPEDPNVIPLDTIPFQNINAIPMPVENVRPNAAILVQQIKDQVIDRILVSTNDIATDKTVKVIISPNVLEATEVNFQKMGDVLSIQFVSRSEGSLQFLQSNQTNLQGYLQTELKQFKDISVSVRSNGDAAEYPGDGRSRNRYEYQAVDEDEQ